MSHTVETLISSLDNSFLVFMVLLLCQLLYTLVMVDAVREADGPEQWSSELLWMFLCISILFSPTVITNLVFLQLNWTSPSSVKTSPVSVPGYGFFYSWLCQYNCLCRNLLLWNPLKTFLLYIFTVISVEFCEVGKINDPLTHLKLEVAVYSLNTVLGK